MSVDEKIRRLKDGGATPEVMQIVLLDELCSRISDLNETMQRWFPRGEGELLENVLVTDKWVERPLRYTAVSMEIDNDIPASTNDVYLSMNYKGHMEMKIAVTTSGGPFVMLIPSVRKAWLRCNQGLTSYVDVGIYY